MRVYDSKMRMRRGWVKWVRLMVLIGNGRKQNENETRVGEVGEIYDIDRGIT